MAVYEDDKNDLVSQSNRLPGGGGSAPNDNDGEDGKDSEDQRSDRTAKIRGAERNVGSAQNGKSAADGGDSSSNSATSRAAGRLASAASMAANKLGIKNKEQAADGGKSGFWKGDDKEGSKGGKHRKQSSWKKRLAVGGVGGLVGVGGFFGIGSIVEGPLAVTHFGQLLEGFHLSEKSGQNNGRILQQMRYLYYLNKGTPEKSRLGFLGNKFATAYENKLRVNGVEPIRNGALGYQDGYRFYPQDYNDPGFNANDRSPQGVKRYLETKYGYKDVTIVNHKDPVTGKFSAVVEVNEPGLFGGRKSMRYTYGGSGMSGADYLGYRFHAKKAGLTLHPILAIDRAIYKSADARLEEFKKRFREKVLGRTETPLIVGETDPNKKNDGAEKAKTELGDVQKDATAAGEGLRSGKPGTIEKFATSMKVKITAGGAGLAAIVCAFRALFERADEINRQNIQEPLEAYASMVKTAADQVEHGSDEAHASPLDEEQVAHFFEMQYDAKTQTSYTDARSVQAELGNPLSGPDFPKELRTKPTDNYFYQFINGIPGIDGVCNVIASPGGTVALTILGGIVSPGGTILSLMLAATGAPQALFEEAAKSLAGAPVQALAEGALGGNYANYGMLYAANGTAQAEAGGILTQQQAAEVKQADDDYQKQDFQNRSFASRMFDIQDRRSFVAQVFDNTTAPTPSETATKFASGFLNIGRNTVKTFGSLLSVKANAAPLNKRYDYGIPDIGFSVAEITAAATANPYENAHVVAGYYKLNPGPAPATGTPVPGILDAQPGTTPADNLIIRAKTCYGVDLVQVPDIDNPNFSNWTITKPSYGEVPTYAAMAKPENMCSDKSQNWLRVRFFIWDSQLANAQACTQGDDQACIAIGLKAG